MMMLMRGGMVQETSKKSKKKKNNQVNLLLTNEEDDFVKDNTSHIGDESGDEDDDVDEGDYSKFMEEVSKLDGKKQKISGARSEGGGQVSEFNLAASRGTKVGADSLLSALGPSADNNVDVRTVSKRLKQGDKEELAVPLEKVVQERIVRAAGYTGAKKEISVWDAVVHSRRAADQVTFPLLKPDLKLKGASEMKTRLSASTPLEQQVAAVLASSRAVVREGETLSEIEKKGLEGLTAKEAEERKAELAKIRALQTYQEAKFRRQGKIKSKKFRKIARKEKEKEKLQELERLQATDPEAAKEKLEEMEKVRIGERASLKHRNASWSTIVVDDATVAGAALLGEGDDHQGDAGVEGEVGDGHPVLQTRPVADDEYVEIFDAAAEGDHDPEDEEAAMPHPSSDEKEDGAEDAKKGIEDAVLDNRTDADVFALAILLVDKL